VPVPRQKCATLQDNVERLVGGIILICIHSVKDDVYRQLIHNLKFPTKGESCKYSICIVAMKVGLDFREARAAI
jgi:hypothetical protein